MKILIITQVIDKKDSALGFFHKWAAMISAKLEHTEIICLKEGVRELPEGVQVHSLGKETAEGSPLTKRFRYILNFYKLAWKLRGNYDVVFVHMNQEYILLFGIIWKLMGKKIYMWRNHYAGNILTDIAAAFCTKVFCTSRFSYTAKYKKTVLMPVGVDEDSSRMDEVIERKPRSIISLGRLDPSKRPDLLIEALGIISKQGVDFTASFVGGESKSDLGFGDKLRAQVESLGLKDKVTFVGAVPNTDTFRYYRSHEIFVNCSKSGMFDKTIFKAVVCGCLVLVTSRDFEDLAGKDFIFADGDAQDLARKLMQFLKLSKPESDKLKGVLADSIKNHSLPILAERLGEEII